MFCSKCGAKNKEDAKFCKKCGSKIAEEASQEIKSKEKIKDEIQDDLPKEVDKKEEVKEEVRQEIKSKEKLKERVKQEIISEEEEKEKIKEEIKKELRYGPRNRWGWSSCLVSILVFIFIIGAIIAGTGTTEDQTIASAMMAWPICILGLWFLIWLIITLVKSFKKNWKMTIVGIIMILILLISPVIFFVYYVQNQTVNNIASFQTSFSQAMAAKFLGDDIVSGKVDADFGAVKDYTKAALASMSKIKSPDEYETRMISWVTAIDKAAESRSTWTNLPEPSTGLNMSAVNKLVQASLDRVVALKDYGDWAIASGNRGAMREIAGELEVENLYLSNMDFNEVSVLDSEKKLVGTDKAYARCTGAGCAGSVRAPQAICPVKTGCGNRVKKHLTGLVKSARNYAVSEPQAAQEWKDRWADFLKDIVIKNGYNLEAIGAIKDGKTVTPISPMEQAFNNDCQSRGGTPNTVNGVKDRLPATLPAGTLNCDYKDNGRNCWDVMTRTGQRFMGGESGCQEQGLLPKPLPTYTPRLIPNRSTSTTTPTKTTATTTAPSRDGTYHVNFQPVSCNVSTSTGYNSIFNSAGATNTIVVSGGQVRNFNGSTSAIDSAGNSSSTFPINVGAGTANFTTTYHFSGNSVSGQIVATIDVTSAGQSGMVRCSEDFSGSK